MNAFFVIDNPAQTATIWTMALLMWLALYLWLRKECDGKIQKSDVLAVASILGLLVVPLVMGAIVGLVITALAALYTLLFSLFKWG